MSISSLYKKGEIIKLSSLSETEAFANNLAKNMEAGDVLGLVGDLGTGKTALTKFIAKALGIKETISSPTFNIIKEYHSGRLPLYHYDVYRLGSEEELLDIGGDEYFDMDGVCIIEWADIVMPVLPEDALILEISYSEDLDKQDERIVCAI